MTAVSDAELRTLVDRLAIQEQFDKYCDALDHRRWELFEEIFAPNVITHWPAGTNTEEQDLPELDITGRDTVVRWLQMVFTIFGPTHHMASNLVLDLQGHDADATMRVRAYHQAKDPSIYEESLARFSGHLRRTAAGWQFTEFRETIVFALGTPDELMEYALKQGITA